MAFLARSTNPNFFIEHICSGSSNPVHQPFNPKIGICGVYFLDIFFFLPTVWSNSHLFVCLFVCSLNS